MKQENTDRGSLIVAKESFFDEDKLLWETYIGFSGPGMPLLCSAWGSTQAESRLVANNIAAVLKKEQIADGGTE